MIRRDFIRLASFAAGALPSAELARSIENHFISKDQMIPGQSKQMPLSGSVTSTYDLFLHPENAYRPFVRWWWNGDRLSEDEILRELDVLKAAGIGGVEINPIKFPDGADPMDTRSLTWLSDEWINMLEVALKGAKERELICDMIVGSGWPYGGEFLSRAEQTQMIALGTRNLSGSQHLQILQKELLDSVNPAFSSPYQDRQKELFSLRLVPAQMSELTQGVSLDKQMHQDSVGIDVPAGDHILYVLVKLTGFMAVINGAPGANGPVLNHYNAQAVDKYLNRLSDKLSARLGPLGNHFRAFFTDSIELEGANWCSDMFFEFRKRRGYDLAPWFPFILFKVGEMGNAVKEEYGASFTPDLKEQIGRVRYDFETTKHELFQERFIGSFAKWCSKVGVKSRMQAYGMDCDPIASGMMLDIPECETWIQSEDLEEFGEGDYHRGRSYTMINKFVSSSAHLAGKKLISCEEMTNTEDPFHTSMERIKRAGDQSILSGVTHSVLHGFNYSPLKAPFPGWVRYGTYFSERNTWWPYFKLWTDYKSRLYALFQQSVMQADIAILHPLADMASKYGFQRDPFPRLAYPPYVHKLWETVHQNGSGCDYVSEDIISNSTIRDGEMVFRDRSYKAILLPEVESMRPSTAKMISNFAESGGKLLFIGKAPHLSTGLTNHAAQSKMVEEIIGSVLKKHPRTAAIISIDEKDIVNWYRDLQRKYFLDAAVLISRPTDFVSQLHYREGSRDIFFFTNYGPRHSSTFEAVFNTGDKTAWLWDPETGRRSLYPIKAVKNTLTITLGPSESRLIVFDAPSPSDASAEMMNLSDLSPETIEVSGRERILKGPWEMTLKHVNGTVENRLVQDLVDFSQKEELRSFAGVITYRNHFYVEDAHQRLWLDLGHIRCVSELEVNGSPLGVRWYGEHLYNISGSLIPGLNRINIRLVTSLGNYMKTLSNNKAALTWTSRTPFYPMGLTEPVRLLSIQ